MSELMFPGGIVRIDEREIWKKLSAWIGEGRDRRVHAWITDGKLFVTLECRDSGDVFRGASKLGFNDAVAQALQAAYAKHEHTPDDHE